jgi:hypothetical protein
VPVAAVALVVEVTVPVVVVPVVVVPVVVPGVVPLVVPAAVLAVTGGLVRLLAADPAGVLTAGVTTVVTPPPVPMGGTTIGAPAGVSDACGGCAAGGVVGGGFGTAGAIVRTTGGPSSSTQFTSRFEQKLGIDVRSVDTSAADASPAPVAASTRTAETMGFFFMAGMRLEEVDGAALGLGRSRRCAANRRPSHGTAKLRHRGCLRRIRTAPYPNVTARLT